MLLLFLVELRGPLGRVRRSCLSAAADNPSEKAKTVERLMPITRGVFSSIRALSTCHSQSSACWPRPTFDAAGLVSARASNTPPCDVPPSAIRCTRRDGAASVSPRTCRRTRRSCGAAPRKVSERRQETGLAHRHDPHVDSALAHEGRQERVEALLEPVLPHRRLLAQRAERTLGCRLCGGRAGEGRAEDEYREDLDTQALLSSTVTTIGLARGAA